MRSLGAHAHPYGMTTLTDDLAFSDLLVIEMVRHVAARVEQQINDPLLADHHLGHVRALLSRTDGEISVPHPDEPFGPPIYEGRASEAHFNLIEGVYAAHSLMDTEEHRLVVGPSPWSPSRTASAVVSPAGLDSRTRQRALYELWSTAEPASLMQVARAVAETVGLTEQPGRYRGGRRQQSPAADQSHRGARGSRPGPSGQDRETPRNRLEPPGMGL